MGGARDAARHAADVRSELIRHPLEGVSAVCRNEDDGWLVDVDVVVPAAARIPDSTSLLATCEAELDPGAGALLRYRRLARYRRGAQDQ